MRPKTRAAHTAFYVCLLLCSAPQFAGAQSDFDVNDAKKFVNSIAASLYNLAWPTATYKGIKFDSILPDPNGLVFVADLYGEGLCEDNLWLQVGIVVNVSGIQDVKILGDDAVCTKPFATTKAVSGMANKLWQQYNSQQSAGAGH
ncbi:MAG TPA: hypothetical protein VNH44_19190 [Micropepsaceae bacterium]|nr:hypothetical protein [Micropepsaceae bacterium]